MILYLDASALVKQYVAEVGSRETARLIKGGDVVGTAAISRAEVSAALAKAARVGVLSAEDAGAAIHAFRARWPDLVRLQVTETLIARADTLAWDHGLRGYDAVHLAGAVLWQETLGEMVTVATFDRELWQAACRVGMMVWPADLARFAT